MNPEKVVFGFFIVLALTLNAGFVYGSIDNLHHHNIYEFGAVCVVNFIATLLKFGDRSQVGAILLATSFVADLQLAGAAIVWGALGAEQHMASIVSLSLGAMVANIVSVQLLVIETVTLNR